MKGATAKVSVSVAVAPAVAFELFTRDIDLWWRRGIRFRHSGRNHGLMCLEPRLGGRLFESIERADGAHVIDIGRVTVWDPPRQLSFSWRNVTYGPGEETSVDVIFIASGDGTLLTVSHRGLDALPPDHPARHGNEDAAFIRMIGLWWGAHLNSLRELSDERARSQYSNS